MRLRLLSTLFLLVAWASPSAAQAAPPPQPVRSFTIEISSPPLAHALVTFDGPVHGRALTDEHGRVALSLPDGDYHFTFEGFAGPRFEMTERVDARMSGATVTVFSDPAGVEIKSPRPDLPTSEWQGATLRGAATLTFDRIDVGGSEGVRQPGVLANGAGARATTWLLDGTIPVTSISRMGFSAAHASSHLFDPYLVNTTDFNSNTPGAAIALQLPSSTMETFATAYGSVGLSGLSAHTVDGSSGVASYRRIDRDVDGGFELGGPIKVDGQGHPTLTGWAAYDLSTPRLAVWNRQGSTFTNAASDSAVLHDGAARLVFNPLWGQVTFTYFGDHLSNNGVDGGATRPPDSALQDRQTTNVGAARLTRRVFGLYLDAQYSLMSERNALDPASGGDTPAYRDAAGIWHNGFQFIDSNALQHDASAYLVAPSRKWFGAVLFGAALRRATIDRLTGWPGGQFSEDIGYPVLLAHAVQDRRELGHAIYLKAFAEDHIQWRRLSVDADILWDRQASSADAMTIAANPIAPVALPAIAVPGQSNVVVWSVLSPRASLALDLGRSQVSASYARVSTPMDTALGADLAGAPMSAAALVTVIDKNGDHVLSSGDTSNVATTVITSTRVGTTSSPRTDIVSGGWSAHVRRVWVRADVTFQQTTDTNWLHLDGITGANFTSTTTVSGSIPPIQTYSVPLYRVNGAQLPSNFLQTYEARPGYSQQYLGFGASVRSTSPRHPWTIGFSSGQTQEHFDAAAAHYDPTPLIPSADVFSLASANVDAGDVAYASVDSNGQSIFVTTPRYQLFAAATLDLRWHLRVTPAYFMREGFALPYFSDVPGSADASSPDGKNVLLTGGVAAFKLPAVHEVDVRISRPLGLFGRASTIDVDVFNVLNRATPLARDLDVRSATFNQITEVMSPLTVRIGVRVPIR